MADRVGGRRRQPVERLYPTAELIQDEIVSRANRALVHQLQQRQPEETVQLWAVKSGGLRRLCGRITRELIRQGTQDGSTEGQFQIAQGLLDVGGRQRRRAVRIALLGHKGRGRPLHPIRAFRYPDLTDLSLNIVDQRRFIGVATARGLGGVAAAVVVRTNPERQAVQSVTAEQPMVRQEAEYPNFDLYAADHPDFLTRTEQPWPPAPQAPPALRYEDLVDDGTYQYANRVLGSLFMRREAPPPPDLDGPTDDQSNPQA